MRFVSPGRLLALGLVLVAVALAFVVVPSSEYIFLPDRAHPVAPLVTVPGGHDPRNGSLYYVDVIVRKATLLERIFGGLHSGATLYPAHDVNPPCIGDRQLQRINAEDMALSQQSAAAVALRAAGRRGVVIRPTGALVEEVFAGAPADCKLQPDDVITAIDGKRVTGPLGVYDAMKPHRPGDVVAFTVRRGAKTVLERIKTIADPRSQRAVVGIFVRGAYDIHLPIPVRIDAGSVGGPSAGLAFALDILAELGKNVLHGHTVAATGEIYPDGSVHAVGGIKQKTIGAREARVDAFLVPAGDNAAEARKYAKGLTIIPVESFPQALHALATLR